MTTHYNGGHWQTQLPVDFIDTSIVINTWETVSANLSGGKPAKIWWIIVEQTNNGATAEDIELELTIPHPVTGVPTPYTFSGALNSGVQYFGMIYYNLTAGDLTPLLVTTTNTVGNPQSTAQGIPFTTNNVGLIRVRQTSAVDVVSAQIEVNIVWDKLVDY